MFLLMHGFYTKNYLYSKKHILLLMPTIEELKQEEHDILIDLVQTQIDIVSNQDEIVKQLKRIADTLDFIKDRINQGKMVSS